MSQSCTSSFSRLFTKQDVGTWVGVVRQYNTMMIAPLVLYLSLITKHHTVFRGNIRAQHRDSSEEIRTTTNSSQKDFSVTSTEKYEEIFTKESTTRNSYQELFKLNSTLEGNPDIDETVFFKTLKVIPSSMIGYYQTNFSHSAVVVEGKIRKVFSK